MAETLTAAEIRAENAKKVAAKAKKKSKAKPGAKRGRPKGSVQKRTAELITRINDLCADGKDDPVEFLIKVMHRTIRADIDQRIEAAKTLMQYLYPKRKAVEWEPPGKNEDYTEQGQQLAQLLFAADFQGHQISVTPEQLQELQALGTITMPNGLKLMQT